MQFLSQWLKENGDLHHAHLMTGDGALIVPALENFFEEELAFPVHGNPDYWKEEFVLFGVEEGHRIAELQSRKGLASSRKIFVLIVASFSVEAQNALLKMFEEPTHGTHFFIVVPSESMLIPTLRSRLLLVPSSGKFHKNSETGEAKKFFEATVAERMRILATIIEEKNKPDALEFLDSIEAYAHELFLKNPDEKSTRELLEDIVCLRGYMRDRSPSIKMILEHLAHTASPQ